MQYWEASQCRGVFDNDHWKWTHRMALAVSVPIAEQKGRPPLDLDDVHKYFAHGNSARCKSIDRGHRQAPDRLFRNCREFIGEEIQILDPQIIVAQGNLAHQALDSCNHGVLRRVQHPEEANPRYHYRIVQIGDHEAMELRVYYPSENTYYRKEFRDEGVRLPVVRERSDPILRLYGSTDWPNRDLKPAVWAVVPRIPSSQ